MVGCIRLYLEPNPRVPEQHRTQEAPAVVHVMPEEARAEARRWRRAGYVVMMVAL
ncbi:MAG: hypothetical protein ACO289_02055 [Prochlorococcaceae cyanobacterium]